MPNSNHEGSNCNKTSHNKRKANEFKPNEKKRKIKKQENSQEINEFSNEFKPKELQIDSKTPENSSQIQNKWKNNENQMESNGKLSFYLDGRFVLELIHKPNGKNKNGIWTQSKGTTWTPKPEFETKNANGDHSKPKNNENLYISSTTNNRTTKPQRFSTFGNPKSSNLNSFLTLKINRRRDHHKISPRFSIYRIKKIARNPFSIDLNTLHESDKSKMATRPPKSMKMRKIDDVSTKCQLINGNMKNTTLKNVKRWFDEDKSIELEIKRENQIDKTPLLPEWYLDPSKSQIPVSEMIGYPRPYMPNTIKSAKTNEFDGNSIKPRDVSRENPKTDLFWAHKNDQKNIFIENEEPLDLRTSAVRSQSTPTHKPKEEWTTNEDKKPEIPCYHKNPKENHPFYLGLIPLAMHGQYSSQSPTWPCVTCPVVAYAPTVVNSYYYCCCFLRGNRNCHCKTRSVNECSESIRKEHPTDLSKMCNRNTGDENGRKSVYSGSMLKDLLLMKGKEEGSD